MELILKSADMNLPQSIENLEQLKKELVPKLEKYNNLVVTEDSIKAAKDDKAALNKLKKAIEEQRISIKKQYLEPYNLLESQCKEVVKLIDEPIQAIDKQIKAFDEIEKKQKESQNGQAAANAPKPQPGASVPNENINTESVIEDNPESERTVINGGDVII